MSQIKNLQKIEINGKEFDIFNNLKEFKQAIDLVKLKDRLIAITWASYTWGAVYLLVYLTSKDLFLLVMGIYFIIFGLISQGKYSPKYFISHSIAIYIIAISNIVFIYSNGTAASRVFWAFFSVYQIYYATSILRQYFKSKIYPSQKIIDNGYVLVKNMVNAIRKSKLNKEKRIIEVGYGFAGSRTFKILLADNIAIILNLINSQLTLMNLADFKIEKLKKIFLEKKYRVRVTIGDKIVKGVMKPSELEKYAIYEK